MGAPDGFDWRERKDGSIMVTHHGGKATVLRGDRARTFMAEVEDADPAGAQELMARLTGNYKRGNERAARKHPRNR